MLVIFTSLFVVSSAQHDSSGAFNDSEVQIEKADADATFSFDTLSVADKTLVSERKLNDSGLKKLKEEDAFWYVNKAPQREKPKIVKKSGESIFAKQWFRNLMWFLIVGGFVAIMIWFLVSSDVKLFQRKPFKITTDDDDIFTENIFDINYENEIDKAIAGKDFRLATRLLYLQLLKQLTQKGLIKYKQESTNSDYVLQLAQTAYYKDFFRLTRSFEYTWYGQFLITEQTFLTIRNDFFLFKNSFS